MTEPVALEQDVSKARERVEYWTFISYRHADNVAQDRGWASWLHREIERYEVPAELVDAETRRGEVIPERIYPVFRDESSLAADADLSRSIADALDRSKFLVVLCSPRAVESRYVNEEILSFKRGDKGDRIIAAILAGEPNHPTEDCFPSALKHPIRPDGTLDESRREEPIAADFRLDDGSEGYTSAEALRLALLRANAPPRAAAALAEAYGLKLQLMKLKIIAGVLGVPLETLVDRDKEHQLALQKRRTRMLRRWLTAVGALTVLAAVAGTVAYFQREAAIKNEVAATEQRIQAERSRFRFLAGFSNELRQSGDSSAALALAANAMPATDDPYRAQMIETSSVTALLGAVAERREFSVSRGHWQPAIGLAACADGTVVFGEISGRVGIWRGSSEKPQYLEIPSQESLSPLAAVECAPHGAIAAGARDGTVTLWPSGHGEPVSVGKLTTSVRAIESHPALGFVVGGADGSVSLIDFRGEVRWRVAVAQADIFAIAISPEGLIAAAGADGVIRIQTSDGRVSGELRGHADSVVALAYLSDGRLASASLDRTARIWPNDSTEPIVIRGHTSGLNGVFETLGERILTISNDRTARLWSRTGEELSELTGHQAAILGAVSTRDRIATFSSDGAIRLWSAEGVALGRLAGHDDTVTSLVAASDSLLISASADRTLRSWKIDPVATTRFDAHTAQVWQVREDADGRVLSASADGSIRLSASNGEPIATMRGHQGWVWDAAFGPEGLIVSASQDGTARLWRDDGELVKKLQHDGPVFSVAVDARGRILTASEDGAARLWDAEGVLLKHYEHHSAAVRKAIFRRDGAIITISDDKTAVLIQTDVASPIILAGHTAALTSASTSRSGQILTTARDNTARIWSADGRPLRVLKGHTAVVWGGEFSSDGRIATYSEDKTARLWSSDGGPVAELVHPSWVRDASFLPNGWLATASGDGKMRIWDRGGEQLLEYDVEYGWAWKVRPAREGRILIATQLGKVLSLNFVSNIESAIAHAIEVSEELQPLDQLERCRYYLEVDDACNSKPGRYLLRNSGPTDESLSHASEASETAKDCPDCPTLAIVPAGTFFMGAPLIQSGFENARPRRPVRIRSFALGALEVTRADWIACVSDGFCRTVQKGADDALDTPMRYLRIDDITGGARPGFLAWLNEKVDGAPYRLPSEAEWEYAALGGLDRSYPWGDSIDHSDAAHLIERGENPPPARSGPPNIFGLYNMVGGVAEYTADCWHLSLHSAPQDGRPWRDEFDGDCNYTTIKGMSYRGLIAEEPVFNRHGFWFESVSHDLGFRVARDVR